jgi:hypothetical protein
MASMRVNQARAAGWALAAVVLVSSAFACTDQSWLNLADAGGQSNLAGNEGDGSSAAFEGTGGTGQNAADSGVDRVSPIVDASAGSEAVSARTGGASGVADGSPGGVRSEPGGSGAGFLPTTETGGRRPVTDETGGVSAEDSPGGSGAAAGESGAGPTTETGGRRPVTDETGGVSAEDSPGGSGAVAGAAGTTAAEGCEPDAMHADGTLVEGDVLQLDVSDCARHAVYYTEHQDEWSWVQETDSRIVASSSVWNMVNAWAYCSFRVPRTAEALSISFEGGQVTIDPSHSRDISGGGLGIMTYEGCSTPAAATQWGDATGEETFYKSYGVRPDWNRQLEPETWTIPLKYGTGIFTIALVLVDAWEAVPVTVAVDGITLALR